MLISTKLCTTSKIGPEYLPYALGRYTEMIYPCKADLRPRAMQTLNEVPDRQDDARAAKPVGRSGSSMVEKLPKNNLAETVEPDKVPANKNREEERTS